MGLRVVVVVAFLAMARACLHRLRRGPSARPARRPPTPSSPVQCSRLVPGLAGEALGLTATDRPCCGSSATPARRSRASGPTTCARDAPTGCSAARDGKVAGFPAPPATSSSGRLDRPARRRSAAHRGVRHASTRRWTVAEHGCGPDGAGETLVWVEPHGGGRGARRHPRRRHGDRRGVRHRPTGGRVRDLAASDGWAAWLSGAARRPPCGPARTAATTGYRLAAAGTAVAIDRDRVVWVTPARTPLLPHRLLEPANAPLQRAVPRRRLGLLALGEPPLRRLGDHPRRGRRAGVGLRLRRRAGLPGRRTPAPGEPGRRRRQRLLGRTPERQMGALPAVAPAVTRAAPLRAPVRAPRVDSRGSSPQRPGGTMAVIEVERLTKRFGKKVLAVDDVSFAIEAGSITGFLGPNGAGKTTTLRMILDLVRPTSGSARVLGSRYRDLRAPADAGRRAARRLRLPSRPLRAQRPARDRRRRPASPTHASTRRSRWSSSTGLGQARREGLLHGHEAAPGPGGGAARRPRGAAARRAGQRPRPRGHPLAARLPARARRRGPHRARLQPRAGRGGADRRRRAHHQQGQSCSRRARSGSSRVGAAPVVRARSPRPEQLEAAAQGRAARP